MDRMEQLFNRADRAYQLAIDIRCEAVRSVPLRRIRLERRINILLDYRNKCMFQWNELYETANNI